MASFWVASSAPMKSSQGVSPPMADGEQPICVIGEPGSSGRIAQGIINAIIAPNNVNTAQPTIFAPSVSHWLALVNYQTGRQIFDLADSPPTALAPVVMAIWESRLNAIQEKTGREEVGWEELLAVLNSPNGWADYNVPGDRTTVYYGHTDPFISSTALSTLIAEFYASARYNSDVADFRKLSLEQVNDPQVQQGVRDIEELIRHYSARTTEFKEYIAQGPDYLDFVALEENDPVAYYPSWHQAHSLKMDLAINWRGDDGIWKSRKKDRYLRSSSQLKYATGLPYTEYLGYLPLHLIDQDESNPEDNINLPRGNRNTAFVPPYFRWDIKALDIGKEGKWNLSWTVLNIIDKKNIYMYFYNTGENPPELIEIEQFPFFPILLSFDWYF